MSSRLVPFIRYFKRATPAARSLIMRILAILALALAGCAQSYAADEPPYGPINNGMREKAAFTGPSAWYNKPSASYAVDQCNVLVDSTGPAWSCLYRLSAMCVAAGGHGYSVGAASFDGPIALPVVLGLYQPPLLAPTGYIEIAALGASARIGLNGPAVPWVQAATYQGGSCDDIVQPPAPPSGSPHYARLCRQYGLYCGG